MPPPIQSSKWSKCIKYKQKVHFVSSWKRKTKLGNNLYLALKRLTCSIVLLSELANGLMSVLHSCSANHFNPLPLWWLKAAPCSSTFTSVFAFLRGYLDTQGLAWNWTIHAGIPNSHASWPILFLSTPDFTSPPTCSFTQTRMSV